MPALPALLTSLLLSAPQHVVPAPENPALPQMPRPSASRGPFEQLLELNMTPGNPAVSPKGRLFVTMHPFGVPEIRVAEVLRNGGLRPYPTDDWAHAVGAGGVGIQSIIGIRCDAKGVLWLLDAGNLGSAGASAGETRPETPPKLIAWDTMSERLVRVIHLPPPISSAKSFFQDFAVDTKRDAIYIADPGIGQGFAEAVPSIVVVYLKTGMARRALVDSPCVRAEPDASLVIDGREVGLGGEGSARVAARVGVDPITIDDGFEWVYFGPMHGRSLYKVKADDLVRPGLPQAELEARVVRHGDKPVCDGISIDSKGNVYVTDLAAHAVGVIDSSGAYRVLHQDAEWLQWPDGLAAGADGKLYVTVNQLHLHPALNGGESEAKPPYRVLRFEPLAPATLGR